MTQISYMVNGEVQTSRSSIKTLREILWDAGRDAAVDRNQIDCYYLERMNPPHDRIDNLDAEVLIRDGEAFLIVHVGKTPVA